MPRICTYLKFAFKGIGKARTSKDYYLSFEEGPNEVSVYVEPVEFEKLIKEGASILRKAGISV